jgi:outer membrane protein OmpU
MNNTFKLAAVSSAALMIAAAPAMADGPTLKLGGYFDQKLSIMSNDSSALRQDDLDVRTDVEVYFLGAAQLDNGIKIRTRVELEGGTTGTATTPDGGNSVNGGAADFDQIDEAFMVLSGSFGAIKVGMSDTAAKSMTTGLQGSWMGNVGENMSFNMTKLMARPATVSMRPTPDAQMDLSSDGEQISYTTPSLGGFQVAVGYAPNTDESFDGPTRVGARNDIMDIGVRYMGKMGDTSFRFGGGYATANEAVVGADNSSAWIVGGVAKMGAIQVSASFSRQDSSDTTNVETTAEIDTVSMGIRYFAGVSQYSLVYARSENDADSTGALAAQSGDEETTMALAMRRTLGKGISWHNTLFYYDAEDGNAAPAAGDVTSNDGFAFTTGIQLKF